MLALYSIGFGYYIQCLLEWVEEYTSSRFHKTCLKTFLSISIPFKEFYWYYVHPSLSIIENTCIYTVYIFQKNLNVCIHWWEWLFKNLHSVLKDLMILHKIFTILSSTKYSFFWSLLGITVPWGTLYQSKSASLGSLTRPYTTFSCLGFLTQQIGLQLQWSAD